MSKAEEKALEAYPIVMSQHSDNCKEYDSNESDRLTFIEGYHQAEKDLELTWEDIRIIKFIFADMMVEVINTEHGWSSQEEFCKKVLNRFNKQKGK